LKSLKGAENAAFSVKYQVLSSETAMVGVIKQPSKATGEMENHFIKMDTVQNIFEPAKEDSPPVLEDYD